MTRRAGFIAATTAKSTGADHVVIARPANAKTGDLLYLHYVIGDLVAESPSLTVPDGGWAFDGYTSPFSNVRALSAYRYIDDIDTEPQSYTFTYTASRPTVAVLQAVRGVVRDFTYDPESYPNGFYAPAESSGGASSDTGTAMVANTGDFPQTAVDHVLIGYVFLAYDSGASSPSIRLHPSLRVAASDSITKLAVVLCHQLVKHPSIPAPELTATLSASKPWRVASVAFEPDWITAQGELFDIGKNTLPSWYADDDKRADEFLGAAAAQVYKARALSAHYLAEQSLILSATGPILPWQASHAYAVGDCTTFFGYVFEVAAAGTSSATPPTFLTYFINDNDVVWTLQRPGGLEPDWLDQHAVDRGTRRSAGERDAALRTRLRNMDDNVTRPGLLAALRAMMVAAGLTGDPAMTELPRCRAHNGTYNTDGSGGTLHITGPDADGNMRMSQPRVFGDTVTIPWHRPPFMERFPGQTTYRLSIVGTVSNDGEFDVIGLDGDLAIYHDPSGVAEVSPGDADCTIYHYDEMANLRDGFRRAFSNRGYRSGSQRPAKIIVMLPYAATASFQASVREMLRQKKAGGVLAIVERRLVP